MKYYIIAGEASGDLHGSNLIKAIKQRDLKSEFRVWGGDLMKRESQTLVKHYKETAYMGFLDVFVHLPSIWSNIRFCKKDILSYRPDALILIDYAGFNLRIAKFAKMKGIKVIWYIAPKVWAWKKSRIKKLKAYVDQLLVIFPFEKDFFAENGVEADFPGNPLLDVTEEVVNRRSSRQVFINENGLDNRPIVALLPGSRMQEIKHHFPMMLKLSKAFPDYQFVVAAAPSLEPEVFEQYMKKNDSAALVYDKTYELLKHARAAVVTSGTATLETAFFDVPQLVCYRGDYISYQIAKRLVDIKYISLVNLIADAPVIKEYIQSDMNSKNLSEELRRLLEDESYIQEMKSAYAAIKEKSGGTGASSRAAGYILKFLNSQSN
jgi:lipid-A-disaccharide synthase